MAGEVASWHLQALFSKGFPLRVMPALQLCPSSWKWEQGKQYNLQLLVFRKFHCAWKQIKLTDVQPLSLYTHPGWQTFSQLMMKAGCSYFPSMWNSKQVSFLRGKKSLAVLSKGKLCFQNMMIQVEFLFRLTSLCRFFSEAICLPKGKVKLFGYV